MNKLRFSRFLDERILGALAVALISVSVAKAADYQSTVLNDSPLAFYPLNLNVDTGTTASDVSGNNNPGTLVNIGNGFNNAVGPSAYITNAISFDGGISQQFIDLGDPDLFNFSGPITMEAWVQPASPTVGSSSPANILGKGYDSAQGYDELVLRANGGYYYGGTYSSTNSGNASGGQQTANWAYLTSTYDGTHWNMYVNGKLVGQGADTVGAINFADPWRIGTGSADGASRYFDGNITEVAMYNHALTAAQVITHYAMGQYGVDANTSVPIITTQPQSQSNFPGNSVTFSVSVLSLSPTTNQWFKNSTALTGQTNATLTLTNVQGSDATAYHVLVGNSNGTTNSASATLSLLASGNSLEWSSADVGNSGVWDTGSSANWINLANSQQVVFNTTDQVLFDDTVDAPISVSVNGSVAPSVFTINSTNNNYTFTGSGPITGAGSMVKKGPSTLTLNVPGGFTGSVAIGGGTVVTAGQNTLGSASSITITNGGTLDLDSQALNQSVIVAGAGVGGAGAIINSGNDVYSSVLNVTLNGDAVFGGSGRWDLASGSSISGPHKLTIMRASSGGYGEWTGVTNAMNVGDIELAVGKLGIKNMGTIFGNPSGNFIVDSGTELDFWTGDPGYAKNFHVLSGGLMQILTSFSSFSGSLILEDGARFTAYGSSSDPTRTMNGAIVLNGVAHLVLGDGNFVFTNVISGPGGFVWDAYNHTMVFQASNTYAGPTVVAQGMAVALSGNGSLSHSTPIFFGGSDSTSVHLDASGRSDQTFTLAAGQTLGGIGAITGNLVASAGATIAPAGTNTTIGITVGATPTGAISASGNVTLGGTTVIKLNGSGANDMVQAGGNITYGGTLNLANISGAPMSVGDTFHIFSAAGYSGSFTITPTTPGSGLAWDTTQLSSGTISVVTGTSQPVLGGSFVSGTNFIFSGSNGQAGQRYVVLMSTNLATPVANWTPVLTNSFANDGSFHVTNGINPASGRGFYLLQVQ
jgi:hypothetical protein